MTVSGRFQRPWYMWAGVVVAALGAAVALATLSLAPAFLGAAVMFYAIAACPHGPVGARAALATFGTAQLLIGIGWATDSADTRTVGLVCMFVAMAIDVAWLRRERRSQSTSA
jgi:hypothetical protein